MRAAVLVAAFAAVIAAAALRSQRDEPDPSPGPPAPKVDVEGVPGQPPCAATPPPFPVTRSSAPVNTSALGERAPAPYELGSPTTGTRPHGVMVVVHGGAWTMAGEPMLSQARPEASLWRGKGWATANVDYRPCGHSLADVLLQYDLIRTVVGPTTPVCLDGESAGGQLALMVAALRPDVACVLARAAPTDGETLGDQDATDPSTGAPSRLAPQRLEIGMAQAFGEGAVRAFSPTTYAGSLGARLLLVSATDDTIVPPAQATELANAVAAARPGASVRTLLLAPGPHTWVHGSAGDADLQALAAAEDELVAPWTSGTPAAPEHVDGWW
jgi:acetyl esterase/lipase